MPDDPLKETLRAAMAALLVGDYKERDRQVARGHAILDAQASIPVFTLGELHDGSYGAVIKPDA